MTKKFIIDVVLNGTDMGTVKVDRGNWFSVKHSGAEYKYTPAKSGKLDLTLTKFYVNNVLAETFILPRGEAYSVTVYGKKKHYVATGGIVKLTAEIEVVRRGRDSNAYSDLRLPGSGLFSFLT